MELLPNGTWKKARNRYLKREAAVKKLTEGDIISLQEVLGTIRYQTGDWLVKITDGDYRFFENGHFQDHYLMIEEGETCES